MQKIEQAIRQALQKIDATNPAMRDKLYQTAWQSHEKMLMQMTSLPAEKKQARREALKNILHKLDAEYKAHQPPLVSIPPAAPFSPAADASPASLPPLTQIIPQPEPFLNNPSSNIIASPDAPLQKQESVKRKSPWRGLNILLLSLVAILLFVVWLLYSSLIGTKMPSFSTTDPSNASLADNNNRSVANTPSPLPTESTREAAPTTNRRWIPVFDPVNINLITPTPSTSIQLLEEDGSKFIRLSRHNNEGNSEQEGVFIEIGAGIMEQMRGKNVAFAIVARAIHLQQPADTPPENLPQLIIGCDFGIATQCGRWRFELPQNREELLFAVNISSQLPPDEASSGRIFISSDWQNSEHQIDIFAIEVSFND